MMSFEEELINLHQIVNWIHSPTCSIGTVGMDACTEINMDEPFLALVFDTGDAQDMFCLNENMVEPLVKALNNWISLKHNIPTVTWGDGAFPKL